jgi:hypothetical protein
VRAVAEAVLLLNVGDGDQWWVDSKDLGISEEYEGNTKEHALTDVFVAG